MNEPCARSLLLLDRRPSPSGRPRRRADVADYACGDVRPARRRATAAHVGAMGAGDHDRHAAIAGVVVVVEGADPEGGATSEAQVESEINRIADVAQLSRRSAAAGRRPRACAGPRSSSPTTCTRR